jgi:hypothetical protein
MDEIVGEAVVVIDQNEHGGFGPWGIGIAVWISF